MKYEWNVFVYKCKDGIRTHWSRVRTVISPRLYLQATTAGLITTDTKYPVLYLAIRLSSYDKNTSTHYLESTGIQG